MCQVAVMQTKILADEKSLGKITDFSLQDLQSKSKLICVDKYSHCLFQVNTYYTDSLKLKKYSYCPQY